MSTENLILTSYQELLDRFKLRVSDAKPYSFDIETFNSSKQELSKNMPLHLKKSGLCSQVLLNQLTKHKCQLGEEFGEALEFYNYREILHLIENLELDKAKGNTFNKTPLKGLHKIHHSPYTGIGYSVILNIKKYWFGKNDQIKKDRIANYQQILKKSKNNLFQILNEMHSEVVSKRMTGEWLIYTKHNGTNYYLCLATHLEGDQKIFDNKILDCYREFPELALHTSL